jgi:hypothetical protein
MLLSPEQVGLPSLLHRIPVRQRIGLLVPHGARALREQ